LGERLLHRNPQPVITSLAVIPLENLSGDPNQEYFADGMTDELITMLAKDSTLHITSRTSVMQYKGAHRPLPEIARTLHVDAIVEGSVSRSTNRVHMTLQLIRADTDTHLWAESYDRDTDGVALLPDNAARAIAHRLNSASFSSGRARYVKPEAHDAYLRGLYYWYAGQNESAGKYFKLATSLQPDYAQGWSGLSSYYGQSGDTTMDPEEALPKAEESAAKALELDPSLADAHLSMGATILFRRLGLFARRSGSSAGHRTRSAICPGVAFPCHDPGHHEPANGGHRSAEKSHRIQSLYPAMGVAAGIPLGAAV
jgi:TolB-like protein